MIEVTILNPEDVKNLYKNHGQFACVCYDTPEKYAEKVGKSCVKDGHMSGSRCEYIKFRIDGIDRGTAEQIMRHEIGVDVPFEMQNNYSFTDRMDAVTDVNPNNIVKNMASFRYIDKDGFDYAVPGIIEKNDTARANFRAIMAVIEDARRDIIKSLENSGIDHKAANEAANFVLPRATTTSLVIGFTPEAFIHFCHKRLCVRAQEFIRETAIKMTDAVREVNPDFAKECIPQCEHLLWCPEGKRGCGRYATREETKEQLEDSAFIGG